MGKVAEIDHIDPLELAIADLIAGIQDSNGMYVHAPEPFYGRLLAALPSKYTKKSDEGTAYDIPTAAVAIRNNGIELIINRDFFENLGREARLAIIKHEAQHIAHRHLFRGAEANGENPKIQNIAMDAVINQFNPAIQELKKPAKDGGKFEPVEWDKIPDATADMSYRGYYELIEKDSEEEGGGGSGEGEGGEGDGDDMGKYGDVIDDHSHFGKVFDESNPDVVEDRLKDTIQKAARGLNPGTMPGEIQKILDDIAAESKIPWQQLLRTWMKTSIKSIRKTHILRESLSVAGVFPGYKRQPRPEFHVYADMSGSVSDSDAVSFFSEILYIQKAMKATVSLHQFDTEIHSTQVIEKNIPHIVRDGYGGTNFQCCADHARENKIKNFIIMTDGYAPSVDLTGLNVLWAFTEHHQDHGGKSVVIESKE